MVIQPGRKKIIKAIVTVATALLTIVATAACGNTTSTTASSKAKTVDVAVSVNQWESVAKIIGGKDISLHVILSNDTVNARDFEPTASDVATLENAQLVLVNGAGYDRWATNAAQQGKQSLLTLHQQITSTLVITHTYGSLQQYARQQQKLISKL